MPEGRDLKRIIPIGAGLAIAMSGQLASGTLSLEALSPDQQFAALREAVKQGNIELIDQSRKAGVRFASDTFDRGSDATPFDKFDKG